MVFKSLQGKNKLILESSTVFDEFIFSPLKKPIPDQKKYYPEKYHGEFNTLGYRSDDFIKNHSGKHILFMGCSETQGCNDSLENAWAYILYNKISEKEKISGYFNISTVGSSISLQINKFFLYISEYGIPDEVYFLTPGTDRNLVCSKEQIIHKTFFNNGSEDKDSVVNSFIYSVNMIRIFEQICELLKVKLLWSTWHEYEEEVLMTMPFNNFFSLEMSKGTKLLSDTVSLYFDSSKGYDENFLKPDGHKGQAFHRYWADEFYSRRLP